jgi:HAD superfamily hydrolase (TIGR01549 family)
MADFIMKEFFTRGYQSMTEKKVLTREKISGEVERPYLLFDAGGTLIFPDADKIITSLAKHSIKVNRDQIYRGYYKVIWQLDQKAIKMGYVNEPTEPWSNGFPNALFDVLGILDNQTKKVARELQEYHINQRNLWTFTYEWIYKTLDYLRKSNYRMSVLTNSDGRANKIFKYLKLDGFFDQIFESKEMNIEKPDPKIFSRALGELNIAPSSAIYIGDFYHVDVIGANRAGVGAIHVDPLGHYKNIPGIHIQDIRKLPGWLSQKRSNRTTVSELFPYPAITEVI